MKMRLVGVDDPHPQTKTNDNRAFMYSHEEKYP